MTLNRLQVRPDYETLTLKTNAAVPLHRALRKEGIDSDKFVQINPKTKRTGLFKQYQCKITSENTTPIASDLVFLSVVPELISSKSPFLYLELTGVGFYLLHSEGFGWVGVELMLEFDQQAPQLSLLEATALIDAVLQNDPQTPVIVANGTKEMADKNATAKIFSDWLLHINDETLLFGSSADPSTYRPDSLTESHPVITQFLLGDLTMPTGYLPPEPFVEVLTKRRKKAGKRNWGVTAFLVAGVFAGIQSFQAEPPPPPKPKPKPDPYSQLRTIVTQTGQSPETALREAYMRITNLEKVLQGTGWKIDTFELDGASSSVSVTLKKITGNYKTLEDLANQYQMLLFEVEGKSILGFKIQHFVIWDSVDVLPPIDSEIRYLRDMYDFWFKKYSKYQEGTATEPVIAKQMQQNGEWVSAGVDINFQCWTLYDLHLLGTQFYSRLYNLLTVKGRANPEGKERCDYSGTVSLELLGHTTKSTVRGQ